MSVEDSSVDSRHFRYIAERTVPEDPFLAELRRDAVAAGIPPISIGPAQASFLQIVLRAAGAREVVEVGTLAGYSAIAMARALPPGGRVRTIEYSEKHAAFARERIARSDVAGKVEVHCGDARRVLPSFAEGSADAAFLDADKAGYPFYLEECHRIVRKGGLVLADNAFAFGQLVDERPTDREVSAVRAFNDVIAADRRLQSVIVPLGDGCWIAVRL